jgi:hypothetical protein
VFLADPDSPMMSQEKSSVSDRPSASEHPFEHALDQPQTVHRLQRRPVPDDPSNPCWKIPASQLSTVLQRIEQGETLRQVAREYGVSYEAVRRVIRATRKQAGKEEE